jgi:hypothetical protein
MFVFSVLNQLFSANLQDSAGIFLWHFEQLFILLSYCFNGPITRYEIVYTGL